MKGKGRKMADKDVTVHTPRPFERFISYVQERAEVDSAFAPADELVEKQADNILTVDNVDALFEAMELAGLDNFQNLENGAEITILNYRLVKSNREDLSGKLGAFAIVQAVNEDGEELALNTSILRIVSFLRMAEVLKLFPLSVKVVKQTTVAGYEVITLAKIKTKPVKSSVA